MGICAAIVGASGMEDQRWWVGMSIDGPEQKETGFAVLLLVSLSL